MWLNAGVLLLVMLTGCVMAFVASLIWVNGYNKGWREARKAPPICPKCKYNLSGLSQCRCPECGTEFRLDELWRTPVVGVKREMDDRTKGNQDS